MTNLLSDKDKETICLIDFQVNHLTARKASDHVIINTLIDFIPDAKLFFHH